MSQVGSEEEFVQRVNLPTDLLARLGNVNPLGVPFFGDQLGVRDAEERLSLVESSFDQSDDGVSCLSLYRAIDHYRSANVSMQG